MTIIFKKNIAKSIHDCNLISFRIIFTRMNAYTLNIYAIQGLQPDTIVIQEGVKDFYGKLQKVWSSG